jgi:creatinine amidohydrolase
LKTSTPKKEEKNDGIKCDQQRCSFGTNSFPQLNIQSHQTVGDYSTANVTEYMRDSLIAHQLSSHSSTDGHVITLVGYSIFADTIADMTWVEVEAAAKKGAIMLVPIGVIEQHGPHLPLATDTYGAYLVSVLAKAELEQRGIDTVNFGMSLATSMFPGTMHINREPMIAVLTEALVSYRQSGFPQQFIISHHGDPQHNDAIMQAILNAREQGVDAVYVLAGFGIDVIQTVYSRVFGRPMPLPPSALIIAEPSDDTKVAEKRLAKSKMIVHAGERETSMIMRWFPDTLKDKEQIATYPPVTPAFEEFSQSAMRGEWRKLSPSGYIGEPHVSSKDNGELYAYEARDGAAAIAKFLKKTD